MSLSRCLAVVLLVALAPTPVRAACGGIFVPQPPTRDVAVAKVITRAAKVALSRDGMQTVVTMSVDFQGAPAEFGLVVPVPTVIQKDDVKVVAPEVFADFEAATAPLVSETEDLDPCRSLANAAPEPEGARIASAESVSAGRALARDYGVKVESHFFKGEYEIAVLASNDAKKLTAWLQRMNYAVPDAAARVLESYIKQNMHFFVARVHVKEMGNEPRFLRPLRVAYKTPKFMLPIRLGMINADGPQELLVFVSSTKGRVEPVNYRTARLPIPEAALPAFVKDDADAVYRATFLRATERAGMRVVFTEATLSAGIADTLGTFTITEHIKTSSDVFAKDGNVVLTRMHFRYDEARFPEDLVLQETTDRAPWRARFHTQKHVYGPPACRQYEAYLDVLPEAHAREVAALAELTGWAAADIEKKLPAIVRK